MRHRLAYAISPDRKTWVDRIERGCRALEAACQSSPLMMARQAEKPDRPITNRREYLRARLRSSGRHFGLGNGKPDLVREHPDSGHVGASGQFYEPGQIVYRFNISFPTDDWSECERIFVSVGDAVDAYSAIILQFKAWERLRCYESLVSGRLAFLSRQEGMRAAAETQRLEGEKLQADLAAIGRQLPRFNDALLVMRDHPAQPKELGWINYWSAQTCEYLGFPDPERDRDLLAHSYRTQAGAWLVKLCPDPLDLGRPEHLGIFANTYARFPKLGIRTAEKKADEPLAVRYPQNTVFIHERDLSKVVDVLLPFLRDRGLQVAERASKGEAQRVTVGVFPGASDWTIIKTIPEEFLADKRSAVEESHFVELCRTIRREGFMLNVYSPIEAVLLETDGAERTHVSGFRDVEGEEPDNAQALESESSMVVSFELLAIDLDILDLDNCGQFAQQLYTELGGENADLCDNERFAASLDGKQLLDRQGVKLRFVLKRA